MADTPPTPKGLGLAYLAAVVLLCAPSFVPYLLSAIDRVHRDDRLLAPGYLLAAAAPFSLIGAVIVGLIGAYRSSDSRVRVAIGVIILTAAAAAIYLHSVLQF